MDKKKIEIIITGFLIVVFMVLLIKTMTQRKESAPVKASMKLEKPLIPGVQKDYNTLNEKFSKVPWKRDPSRMAAVEPKGRSFSTSLTGILWDPRNPTAIFGERFLGVDDTLKGYKILEIKRESVVVSNGETIYELQLGDSLERLP